MCRSEAEWYEPPADTVELTEQSIKAAFPHCPYVHGIVHIRVFKLFGIRVLDTPHDTGFFVSITPNTPYYLSCTHNHAIAKKISRYNSSIFIEWIEAEDALSTLVRTVVADYASSIVGPDGYMLSDDEVQKVSSKVLCVAHQKFDKT